MRRFYFMAPFWGPVQLLSRSPAQLPAGDWYSSHRGKKWCVGKSPIGTLGKTLDWSLKFKFFSLKKDLCVCPG